MSSIYKGITRQYFRRGKFGLWLDDNLYIGRTEECCTFRSPPLVEEKDFKIKTVECWTVGKLV
jgi:hypothetical protein